MSDIIQFPSRDSAPTPCAEDVEAFGAFAPLVQRLDEVALDALCDLIERAEGLALVMGEADTGPL